MLKATTPEMGFCKQKGVGNLTTSSGIWGLSREVVGEEGRAVRASISCSNIPTQTMSRAKSFPTLHRGKSE